MSRRDLGSFIIEPLVVGAASVRAFNILKSVDLEVDEDAGSALREHGDAVAAPPGTGPGPADPYSPTMVALITDPLDAAVAWGLPRLTKARLWWMASVPFTLRLACPMTKQSFIIPATAFDLRPALRELVGFAAAAGPGEFRWDVVVKRWTPDTGGEGGVTSPLTPRRSPPVMAAEADLPETPP